MVEHMSKGPAHLTVLYELDNISRQCADPSANRVSSSQLIEATDGYFAPAAPTTPSDSTDDAIASSEFGAEAKPVPVELHHKQDDSQSHLEASTVSTAAAARVRDFPAHAVAEAEEAAKPKHSVYTDQVDMDNLLDNDMDAVIVGGNDDML
jgi:hypothetical protein